MTASSLVCAYCSHRRAPTDTQCGNCGAPARDAAPAQSNSPAPDTSPTQSIENALSTAATKVGPIAAAAAALAPGLMKAGKSFTDSPGAQWRVVIAALAAMLALAFLVVRSCSPGLAPVGYTSPVEAMPEVLRSAAKCDVLPSHEGDTGKCVIAASDPMLTGFGGGKDLTVSIGVLSADRLAEEVRRWRGAGGTVLADGAAFAAIAPTSAVWYADTRSGLRVETGALGSTGAARAFLVRSGLLR